MESPVKSLLTRSQEARESLLKARIANQNKLQLSAIHNLQSTWSTKQSKASKVWDKFSWFSGSEINNLELKMLHDGVSALALEAQNLLKTSDDVQELSKNDLWTRLLKLADTATNKTQEALKMAWETKIEESGTIETPERIESLMPKTPKNSLNLSIYRETFTNFRRLRDLPSPNSAQDIIDLGKYASLLHEKFNNFVLDMPEEVKLFQQALIAGNAVISLLTPTVIQWLQDNDDITRFVIRVKSNYGS